MEKSQRPVALQRQRRRLGGYDRFWSQYTARLMDQGKAGWRQSASAASPASLPAWLEPVALPLARALVRGPVLVLLLEPQPEDAL